MEEVKDWLTINSNNQRKTMTLTKRAANSSDSNLDRKTLRGRRKGEVNRVRNRARNL